MDIETELNRLTLLLLEIDEDARDHHICRACLNREILDREGEILILSDDILELTLVLIQVRSLTLQLCQPLICSEAEGEGLTVIRIEPPCLLTRGDHLLVECRQGSLRLWVSTLLLCLLDLEALTEESHREIDIGITGVRVHLRHAPEGIGRRDEVIGIEHTDADHDQLILIQIIPASEACEDLVRLLILALLGQRDR